MTDNQTDWTFGSTSLDKEVFDLIANGVWSYSDFEFYLKDTRKDFYMKGSDSCTNALKEFHKIVKVEM